MTDPRNIVRVRISRLDGNDDLPLPAYATNGSSGMDLCAAVVQDTTLGPGERALVPTGFSVEIPQGFEAQVRPRSGLAVRNGISIVNSPGTVDADYRGEVKVILVNLGSDPFVVRRGDRIAQMVVAPVTRIAWEESDVLGETARGDGGFGHTGTRSAR